MKVNFTRFCTLVLLSTITAFHGKAQTVTPTDSLALVDFYRSTHGENWTNKSNWLSASPVSTWYGVTVTDSNVTRISLEVNNLAGSLPSSVGNLSHLQSLYLYNNSLLGAIPASIGKLTDLQELMLGYNLLSGSIPTTIGKLINLQNLDLAGNRLTDSIPLSIGNLVHAEYLNLNNNRLTGQIPTSIGKLANVQLLELAHNQLSGVIPSSIGKLSNLQYLYLQNNLLSGALPSAIGNLLSLKYLYLDNNNLKGVLPSSIGNLVNLELLGLNNNAFSGTIPTSIGKMLQLSYLYLNNNQFTGLIPSSLSKLTKLAFIDASNNFFEYNVNRNLPLPQISTLKINIQGNRFTFDGLELSSLDYPYFEYSPQATRLPISQNGDALSVSAGGTVSKNTYTWFQIGKTNTVVVAGDSIFHPTEAGQYYAQVRNTNATKLILFTDTISYSNSLNKLITSVPFTGEANAFLVYPNPARDIVNVITGSNATVTLLNSEGKIMLVKTIAGKDQIDVSRLVPGTYYLQNKTTGKTQKIIVTH